MKTEKYTYFWRGHDINGLSREELLIALKSTLHSLDSERKGRKSDLDIMTGFNRRQDGG